MGCLRSLRALGAFLAYWSVIACACAAEEARFEGAKFLQEPLTARRALENHIPIYPPKPTTVLGYIQRPKGPGPFPAVVVLHGCAGFGTLFNPHLARNFWPDTLASWGYAVLVVDSFTRRGVSDTCFIDARYYRMQDAFGALLFFSKQSYVDARRIALLGFSAGGIATLESLKQRDFKLFDVPADLDFKSGVAFYPCFGSSLDTAKSLLILNGEADDWSRDTVCQSMMNSRPQAASLVRLVRYPGAYHDFDRPTMRPGRIAFGHWLEYNPDAAMQAVEEVRVFLSETLKE